MKRSPYYTLIEPRVNVFDFHFRELVKYRDLIYLFVKRDFTSRYKQTILGPAWAIIQPLLTTVVFTFIFGNIAGLAECGAVPTFLFYMCGNIAWGYFNGCLTGTANTFIGNAAIMGKVYFPRIAMPISTVISNLIGFSIQFILFLLFLVLYLFNPNYEIGINLYVMLLPVIVFQMALLGLGCGIIISAATTKYRDLAFLVSFGMQLWMYGTPVAYSLDIFQNSKLLGFIWLNPMTSIIEVLRYGFLGAEAGVLNWFYFGMSWIITIAILISGILLFNKVERTFMDTV